jgi:hypothetical protein
VIEASFLRTTLRHIVINAAGTAQHPPLLFYFDSLYSLGQMALNFLKKTASPETLPAEKDVKNTHDPEAQRSTHKLNRIDGAITAPIVGAPGSFAENYPLFIYLVAHYFTRVLGGPKTTTSMLEMIFYQFRLPFEDILTSKD